MPLRRVFILLLVLMLAAASQSVAQTGEDPTTDKPGFQEHRGLILTPKIGVNILSWGTDTNSSNRMAFLAGSGFDYFFHRIVGAFIDLQYNSRGFKLGTQASSAAYLDVPFGIALNHGSIFSKDARSHTRLGGIYCAALGNFSGDLSLGFGNAAKSYFGLFIDNETLFQITERFALGYSSWVKIGLSNATESTIAEVKFWDIGLGFVSAILF